VKTSRHARIQEIIKTQNIETQEDLALALEQAGFHVTQATVSRDIKEMMLIKVPNAEGGYRYAYPRDLGNMLTPGRLQRTLRDAVLDIKSGENIVVLRTMPGTAQGVAFAVDYAKWPEVLGTVAGDDTIFVAIDKTEHAQSFVERIQKLILHSHTTVSTAAEAEAPEAAKPAAKKAAAKSVKTKGAKAKIAKKVSK
jgi:transcriptional regulator of arginine metabolism